MEHKNSKQEEYRFSIEYYIFREGDNLIAYCPSLDISTSGKDYGDAVKNFFERFQIYVETCLELGTLVGRSARPRLESHREKTYSANIQPSDAQTGNVQVAWWSH